MLKVALELLCFVCACKFPPPMSINTPITAVHFSLVKPAQRSVCLAEDNNSPGAFWGNVDSGCHFHLVGSLFCFSPVSHNLPSLCSFHVLTTLQSKLSVTLKALNTLPFPNQTHHFCFTLNWLQATQPRLSITLRIIFIDNLIVTSEWHLIHQQAAVSGSMYCDLDNNCFF